MDSQDKYGYEKTSWGFYDTIEVNSTSNNYSMFVVPIGIDGKTKIDTNMILSGRLPEKQIFIIESISIHTKINLLYELVIDNIHYNEFKLDGPFSLPVVPLLINMNIPFHVLISLPEPVETEIFVSLIGVLWRSAQ